MFVPSDEAVAAAKSYFADLHAQLHFVPKKNSGFFSCFSSASAASSKVVPVAPLGPAVFAKQLGYECVKTNLVTGLRSFEATVAETIKGLAGKGDVGPYKMRMIAAMNQHIIQVLDAACYNCHARVDTNLEVGVAVAGIIQIIDALHKHLHSMLPSEPPTGATAVPPAGATAVPQEETEALRRQVQELTTQLDQANARAADAEYRARMGKSGQVAEGFGEGDAYGVQYGGAAVPQYQPLPALPALPTRAYATEDNLDFPQGGHNGFPQGGHNGFSHGVMRR
jgi:hypothetical protein